MKHFFDKLTFNNSRVVVDDKFENNLVQRIHQKNNNIDLHFGLDLEKIDKKPTNWTPITTDNYVALEKYMRESEEFGVFRKVKGVGNAHFLNYFIDKNNVLNNYMGGEDSLNQRISINYEGNPNGSEDFFETSDDWKFEYSYKYDNNKLYIKSIIKIDDRLEIEEISHIDNTGNVIHDVQIKNISGKLLNNFQYMQEVTQSLNNTDSTYPLLVHGDNAVSVQSKRFFVIFQALENSKLYTGRQAEPHIAKQVVGLPKKKILSLNDAATSVYYGSGNINLEANSVYKLRYRETFRIEDVETLFQPEIYAKNIEIYEGDNWIPRDNFVSAMNEIKEPIEFDKLEIITNADPDVAGIYNVTFKYDDVSTTVTLTVHKKPAIKVETPAIENKKEDTKKMSNKPNEEKTNILVENKLPRKKAVDTSDSSTVFTLVVAIFIAYVLKRQFNSK